MGGFFAAKLMNLSLSELHHTITNVVVSSSSFVDSTTTTESPDRRVAQRTLDAQRKREPTTRPRFPFDAQQVFGRDPYNRTFAIRENEQFIQALFINMFQSLYIDTTSGRIEDVGGEMLDV